jgi:hypothetical protein
VRCLLPFNLYAHRLKPDTTPSAATTATAISTTTSSRISITYKVGWRTIRARQRAARDSKKPNTKKRQDFVITKYLQVIQASQVYHSKIPSNLASIGAVPIFYQASKHSSRYLRYLLVAECGSGEANHGVSISGGKLRMLKMRGDILCSHTVARSRCVLWADANFGNIMAR